MCSRGSGTTSPTRTSATWQTYTPLVWDREPTVEEIVRHLWRELEAEVDGLVEVALHESTEFDRSRTVRLRA